MPDSSVTHGRSDRGSERQGHHTAAGIVQGWNTASSPVSATEQHGRLVDEPAPVDFRAPAALCQPIDGQPYDQVPTERPGITPAWKVEEPVYFGTERGPARIVHRGTCRTTRDLT